MHATAQRRAQTLDAIGEVRKAEGLGESCWWELTFGLEGLVEACRLVPADGQLPRRRGHEERDRQRQKPVTDGSALRLLVGCTDGSTSFGSADGAPPSSCGCAGRLASGKRHHARGKRCALVFFCDMVDGGWFPD